MRYVEDADEAEIVGGWERDGKFDAPLGVRLPFQGGAIARVRHSGETARIDLENEPPDVQEHMVAADVSSAVAAPIVVSGRLWGSTSISISGPDRFPADVEARLEKFTNLVAVALANAEAHEQLTASRARIVQAGDAERRRLERNLHDGAQQRFVSLALGLRLAQSQLTADPGAAADLLARAGEELALGLEELRELARGIHPAVLTDRGLAAAVEALAARATLPVELNSLPSERLPEQIEAAAYYVVSESLANVAKYAAASQAQVDLARDDGLLVVEVSDDGVGGADPGEGSGLRGLTDRVEALGGRLQVSSERGRGTTVRAELPLDCSSSSLVLLEQAGRDLLAPEAEREPDQQSEDDEGAGDDGEIEKPDRLPRENVLDVVERAAANGTGLDLLGRQGEVDRHLFASARVPASPSRRPFSLVRAFASRDFSTARFASERVVLSSCPRIPAICRCVASICDWRLSACTWRSSIP